MSVPLHNHSHKSTLDGLATEDEIGQRCQDVDHWAVGITDHDVCAGHPEFFSSIKKRGLKPILGVETYQTIGPRQSDFGSRSRRLDDGTKEKTDNFHLILLAMNQTGLSNLWAMNSDAHTQGFYYSGRVDWELLEKYNEGIIATSACGLGLLSQALQSNTSIPDVETLLEKYLSIFGDRFYIELSTYSEPWQRSLNYELSRLAKDRGVPMVYANDAHYAFPGQYELHETILCMSQQEKPSMRTEPHHTPDLFIMSEKEVNDAFYYLPQSIVDEAIDNSDAIADRCEVEMPGFEQHVPVFVPEGFKNSKNMIFELAVQGYEEKIASRGLDDAVYMPRFKYEMEVIFDANLYDYFLFVRDVIASEKEQGVIVGPGRGSIGGSLIAYLIGIHEIDPIRYGLIFERFYNPGRKGSMPDIDVDFPTFRAEPIKKRLIKKYGEDYCADIGTVNTFQGRAAIKKIGATLEVPYATTEAVSKIIEKSIESGQQPTWDDIYRKFGSEIEPYKRKEPKLFEYAEIMYGRTFTYGVHASGFVVSDIPLRGSFPLRWNAKEKKPVSQWDMRVAEKLGFMKMDILSLRNLDALTLYNQILVEQGKPQVDFYQVKYMDEDGELPVEMWEQIDRGHTVGIFQIESKPGAKSLGKRIKPRNLEELALLTALNRPGPLKSGAAERYIKARKTGEWTAVHPIVAKVAAESFGEIIYQEQLINFFVELGYTPSEADNVRKITGKKLREEMHKLEEDYVKRFRAAGATDEAIKSVWSVIEGFADYAFNKAHSVEYGLISLWTLYAKWHNRTEFYLGSIKSLVAEGKKGEVSRYVSEGRKLGHEFLPVDLNESEAQTSIQGTSIRYGFNDIKGIGKAAAEWLVANRPFKDFDDIVTKASDPNKKIMLRNGTMRMAVDRRHVELLKKLMTYKDEQLWSIEEELFGYSLHDTSAEILDEYADEIEQECVPLGEIDKPGMYTVAGIITGIRDAKTKAGARMAWVTIENGDDSVDFAVWSSTLERLSFVWRRRQAVLAHVKVSTRGRNIIGAKPLYSKKGNYVNKQEG